MRKLTDKEQEVMQFFWNNGAMFVRDVLDLYSEPKPHYNTVSTVIRVLEEKGFVSHKTYGNTHQYFAVVSQEEYKGKALKSVVSQFFNNSYTNVVSTLIEEEHLSLDELKSMIAAIEKGRK